MAAGVRWSVGGANDESVDGQSFEKIKRHQRRQMPTSCCRAQVAGAKKTWASRRAGRIACRSGGMHLRRVRELFEPRCFGLVLAALFLLGLATENARAVPITITVQPITPGNCELPPSMPSPNVDELGIPFPANEMIAVQWAPSLITVCNGGSGLDVQIDITNTVVPPISFSRVWYVASHGTKFSNWEFNVDFEQAVRIDDLGSHKPLVAGDTNTNTLFDPGETWSFVLETWSNTNGLSPADIITPGIVGFTDVNSSGSIIADPVPEPSTLVLAGVGVLALAMRVRGRRRQSTRHSRAGGNPAVCWTRRCPSAR